MAWGLLGVPTDLVLPPLELPGAWDAAGAALFADPVHTALRHAPLVILCLLQLYATGASGADAGSARPPVEPPEEPCSKALGFNESLGVKDRHAQDLQFCTEHHKRTCCEKNHTRQVLGNFAPFSQERSARCTQMSRLALCSVCDGDVGIGLKSRLNAVILCPTFCARWFQACSGDFFAPRSSGAELRPCGPSATFCSPLGEIFEDSAEFCTSVRGFEVAEAEDDGCFDGVPASRSRGKGPRAAYTKPVRPLPPWWRHLYNAMPSLSMMRTPKLLQDYGPMMLITVVLILFGWYVWRESI